MIYPPVRFLSPDNDVLLGKVTEEKQREAVSLGQSLDGRDQARFVPRSLDRIIIRDSTPVGRNF